MPLPFRDEDDLDALGAAAFLKLVADADGSYRGALLQVTARGEPLEFTCNRVLTSSAATGSHAGLRRLALLRLTASLLNASRNEPTIFCYLATDAPEILFGSDIQIAMPVCYVLHAPGTADMLAAQTEFVWQPCAPPATSAEYRLAQELRSRHLLLEAFERAFAGLQEMYPTAAKERL